MVQLPRFRDVLARILALVKPGGQFISEEIDARTYSEHREAPDAVKIFHDRIYDWAASKGETYSVGREVEPYISGLGTFVDIAVKILAIPFSPGWDGRKWPGSRSFCAMTPRSLIHLSGFEFLAAEVGDLGNTMKQTLVDVSSALVKVVPGLTEECVARWKLALEEPEHKLRLRIYFLTARKK